MMVIKKLVISLPPQILLGSPTQVGVEGKTHRDSCTCNCEGLFE